MANLYSKDISVIGYTGVLNKARIYNLSFVETGLPAASTWCVNITSLSNHSSNDNVIGFSLTNGTYNYSFTWRDSNHAPDPSNGSLSINGSNTAMAVAFSERYNPTNSFDPSNVSLFVDLASGIAIAGLFLIGRVFISHGREIYN